jgi:hypothetical protein
MAPIRRPAVAIARHIYKALRPQLSALDASELRAHLAEHGNVLSAQEWASYVAALTGSEPRTVYENVVRAMADWGDQQHPSAFLPYLVETISELDHRMGVFVVAEIAQIVKPCGNDTLDVTLVVARTLARNWALGVVPSADIRKLSEAIARTKPPSSRDRTTSACYRTAWRIATSLCRAVLDIPMVVSRANGRNEVRWAAGYDVADAAMSLRAGKADLARALRIYSTFWWD